jgi:biotin transport system permease protein
MYSLGRYIPGNSPVHTLDPRTKIITAVLVSVSLVKGGIIVLVLFAILFGVVALAARLPPRALLGALRPMAVVLAVIFGLHLFFTAGAPVLDGIPFITYEGLIKGCLVGWQFAALLFAGAILTMATSPSELVGGIERLLRPLRIFRIPSHDIALMISMALRFVPTLLDEIRNTRDAQAARGADFRQGNPRMRFSRVAGLAIPILLSTFRRADELSMAIEGRAYRRGPRTYLRDLRMNAADFAVLAGVFALAAAVQILSW